MENLSKQDVDENRYPLPGRKKNFWRERRGGRKRSQIDFKQGGKTTSKKVLYGRTLKKGEKEIVGKGAKKKNFIRRGLFPIPLERGAYRKSIKKRGRAKSPRLGKEKNGPERDLSSRKKEKGEGGAGNAKNVNHFPKKKKIVSRKSAKGKSSALQKRKGKRNQKEKTPPAQKKGRSPFVEKKKALSVPRKSVELRGAGEERGLGGSDKRTKSGSRGVGGFPVRAKKKSF